MARLSGLLPALTNSINCWRNSRGYVRFGLGIGTPFPRKGEVSTKPGGNSTGPTSLEPSVRLDVIRSRAFQPGEALPGAEVALTSATVAITLPEWFPSQGDMLLEPRLQFLASQAAGSWGQISLNIESKAAFDPPSPWRKDHRVTVRGITPGPYRVVIMRYDPAIPPSVHPYGNPRLPVDTTVVVP